MEIENSSSPKSGGGFIIDKIERKRTVSDIIISLLNSIRYRILEPPQLLMARAIHEKSYSSSNKNPLITIYTPTYNRGELLIERAVTSVLKQTYENFEYIIVGDCCTDNTVELVSKVRDPRIRFFNLPKKGRGYPLNAEGRWLAGPVPPSNKGLELARGLWIARLDDDDEFTDDHLELLLEKALDENLEFVSGRYIEEWGERNILWDGTRANDPYYTRRELLENDDSPMIGGTSSWMYRSYLKFFKYNVNCWRKSWNRVNDTDLPIRMFQAGVRMGYLEEVVYYYRARPGEYATGLEAYIKAEREGYKVHS